MMRFSVKKIKANIVLSVIIFIITFLIFCICAIDAGYVVVTRYKIQKLTETTALYFASVLNAQSPENRTLDKLTPIKERFESLYTGSLSGYYNFKITNIELKDTDTDPKIKINTEANIPTIFVRYAGIGYIRIMQVSYAAADKYDMELIDSGANSYTYEAKDIITDKNGDDIKIKYDDGEYFVFAGLKGKDGQIYWADLASGASGAKTKRTLTTGDEVYSAYSIPGDSGFDFSKVESGPLGLVRYVKIYKASKKPAAGGDKTTEGTEATGGESESTDGMTTPIVTVLNSVKLIKRSEF